MDDDTRDGRTARLVRPYAITGGRTSEGAAVSLEAQVSATERGRTSQRRYRWEAATLLALCHEPVALVELAARMKVPVDVVRVVVADLAADGALTVHDMPAETSYSDLLEKVLDGIRRL